MLLYNSNCPLIGKIFTLRYLFLLLFLNCVVVGQAQVQSQALTEVKGVVVDSATNEPVPFANISVINTGFGTNSDENGVFLFSCKTMHTLIQTTAVGYQKTVQSIVLGQSNDVKILLKSENQQLQEVVVKSGRYRNKGNPAVELIRKVIAHKANNRLESHDYYELKQYEKIELDMVNVGDKVKKSRYLKNFQFIFHNNDTNTVKGKELLPAFIKETASDLYFRKSPEAKKEYVNGEKQSVLEGLFDADGLGQYIEHLYTNVDIYDNSIMLVNKKFLSPMSPLSPEFYRFYIMDTSMVEGQRCINLAFHPRSKTDLTLVGNLYITDDSLYAVRKVKMSLPEEVNVNFLNNLTIEQEFDKLPDGSWTLIRDQIVIDFGLLNKEQSFGIYGKKVTSRKDIVFDKPHEANLYAGNQNVIKKDDAVKQAADFWDDNRTEPLSKHEVNIYKTVDSIQKVPTYKTYKKVGTLIFSNHLPLRGVELGPYNALYSFNPIEGGRWRFGGRTTIDFSKKLRMDGFGAYGTKDKRLKYSMNLTYQFTGSAFGKNTQNALRLNVNNDVEVPGQELLNIVEDNFFLSFRRGVFDKMYYKKGIGLTYIRENEQGFTYQFGVQQNKIAAAGDGLRFQRYGEDNKLANTGYLKTVELTAGIRYAPNEEYMQGKKRRRRIVNNYPIFRMNYRLGMSQDSLRGSYMYHFIRADVSKRFYLAPFGQSDVSLEAGVLLGRVPFSLLHTPRANQTLSYQFESFNMMNSLEFVNDKYASLNVTHAFGGFFLNKVPLIKKLKWREFVTFKAIAGSLSDQNTPKPNDHRVFQFPTNRLGKPQIQALSNKPYMEASVGVGNIFKLLRVDVIRRLNYLDNPHTKKYGVRLKLKFDF